MDSFIEKSKIKFNNIFSYEKLNYMSTKKPINLICLIHKKAFTTTVRNHLDTNCGGCIDCDFKRSVNDLSVIRFNFESKKFDITNFNNELEVLSFFWEEADVYKTKRVIRWTNAGRTNPPYYERCP